MLKVSQRTLIVIAMGVFLFWLLAKTPQSQLLSLSGSTMGTTWNVQLNTKGDELALSELAKAIEALLFRLDKNTFSTYVDDSELSLLNQAPLNTPVPISGDMSRVLQAAQAIHSASSGSFDITIAPLVDLWGFGPLLQTGQALPSPMEIALAQAKLGTTALVLDDEHKLLLKTKDVQVDLSAIAKGYAVDELAELLLSRQQENFLVEIGGELRIQGVRPDNMPWRIAIELPSTDIEGVSAGINSRGKVLAMAGSGDYRNFREVNGLLYSHEIDPRTGYPIDHALAGVTVLAESAMMADAWATAMMILGPEEGMALANRRKLSVYFIIRNETGFSVSHTDSFTEFLESSESFPD